MPYSTLLRFASDAIAQLNIQYNDRHLASHTRQEQDLASLIIFHVVERRAIAFSWRTAFEEKCRCMLNGIFEARPSIIRC